MRAVSVPRTVRHPSRRSFLLVSGEAIAALCCWPHVTQPLGLPRADWTRPLAVQDPLEFFTPEQANEVDAIAASIIPTDSAPGAREARAVRYIDRSLARFFPQIRSLYTNGLADLQSTVERRFPAAVRFSDLTAEQQVEVLRTVEATPFFQVVVGGTVVGCFADPLYGGNHEGVGWSIIGFEGRFVHEPPFGYYDRHAADG